MTFQNLKPSQSLHGFSVDRVEDIPELRSQATLFTHDKTGAKLIHLFNEDPNNLFCVAFRTPVYNDTGVPHILEHSVLSGSEKFPLKDPFKELLKGSLQTFLNAMTYPDKTIYPVSSQVEADFYNLVNVYCDAVLHPLLTETTFYQEGWHFDVEDVDGPVGIKGIVYNEMKGVFSDFRSHVARRTFSALFPDTTYYYESGGDPEHIPDLTYADFKAFHRKFYHPSNSFFFLYGNLPSEKTLAFLQENYLSVYERESVDSVVHSQKAWDTPRVLEITAPSAKEDDGTASVILSWVLGESTDAVTGLLGKILSGYLLATESSPLRRALIDSGLGEDLDDMCGFDADLVQYIFSAGLRKCNPTNAAKIKTLILDTLADQVKNGLDMELLEGTIRLTEFGLREISDSRHFPHNLVLAERCYRSWLYDGDPLAHLKFAEPLDFIKEQKAKGGGFFEQKLSEMLTDNPHYLLSVVTASSKMGDDLGKQSEAQAAVLTAKFSQDDRKKHKDITDKLKQAQMTPPTEAALASLPKLDKKDLPLEGEKTVTEECQIAGVPCHQHPIFTSGIVYLDLSFDFSVLNEEDLAYLPLFCELVTRCGIVAMDYEQMAKRISLATGGISTSTICSTDATQNDQVISRFFFHAKCLEERVGEMLDIVRDLLLEPVLDDHKQQKDILLEMRNDIAGAAAQSGHSYAALHASSKLAKSRYIDELINGVTQLRFLDELLKQEDFNAISQKMLSIRELLVNRQTCHVCLTSADPTKQNQALSDFLQQLPAADPVFPEINFAIKSPAKGVGVEISSSVNYVAHSWFLPNSSPVAFGLLNLLSQNLATGFLWEKVRVEGGAYGGMAFASTAHPIFTCASYRDPNLAVTLKRFIEGLEFVAAGLSAEDVDQSIIGVIGKLDSPSSPHSKALGETIALLCGRCWDFRQTLRVAILNADSAALAAQANAILAEARSVIAVLGSVSAFDAAESDGVQLERTPLMG